MKNFFRENFQCPELILDTAAKLYEEPPGLMIWLAYLDILDSSFSHKSPGDVQNTNISTTFLWRIFFRENFQCPELILDTAAKLYEEPPGLMIWLAYLDILDSSFSHKSPGDVQNTNISTTFLWRFFFMKILNVRS